MGDVRGGSSGEGVVERSAVERSVVERSVVEWSVVERVGNDADSFMDSSRLLTWES